MLRGHKRIGEERRDSRQDKHKSRQAGKQARDVIFRPPTPLLSLLSPLTFPGAPTAITEGQVREAGREQWVMEEKERGGGGGGGIQRKAKQQQTFWFFQGCLVTSSNYKGGGAGEGGGGGGGREG